MRTFAQQQTVTDGTRAERGVPASLEHTFESPHTDAGAFNFASGFEPEANGAGVARALYGGFGL
jgi:CO dehydrogenase/acetyl-CoA synthase beta subunit